MPWRHTDSRDPNYRATGALDGVAGHLQRLHGEPRGHPRGSNGLADNAARVANPRRFLLIRHFLLALYLAVSTESGASKDAGSCEHQAYTLHQLRDAI
jgi:hypothetical protein